MRRPPQVADALALIARDAGGGAGGAGLAVSWLYVTCGHFEDLPRGNALITAWGGTPGGIAGVFIATTD